MKHLQFKICYCIQDVLDFFDECETSGDQIINIISSTGPLDILKPESKSNPATLHYEVMYFSKN